MSSVSGTLPLPVSGDRIAVKRRVDYKNTEEAALVKRAQAGDEMAFREIVERYQSKVFSIIYGILRNRNDAEDIAQQVFHEGLLLHPELRLPQFAAHLDLQDHRQRVLRLPAQEEGAQAGLRKRLQRRGRVPDGELRARQGSGPPVDVTLAQRDLALKLLAKVSEEERQLLLLKEVEGHSVEELAEMTGMNENTIKVKLFRARQKLLKAAQRLTRTPGLVTA